MVQYVLNDLLIDTASRSVCRGTTTIKLPDLSFDALIAIIGSAPEPVNTATMSQLVWNADHVSDETVSQRIALLRKALGDDPREPVYVRTVRGSGYAITGKVERLEKEPVSRPRLPVNSVRIFATASAVALLMLGGSLFWLALNGDSQTSESLADTSAVSETGLLVARAQQQLGLHQSVETDRAITMLRDALVRTPESFDARLTLSFALSTKATKFDGGFREKKEAEALARALITEQPDNSNAWSALGYTLGSQGRMNESLSALQYAYQLNPNNAPAASSAAYVHLVQGQLYQALDLEFQVIQAGGRSRYAEIQIAQSLELIGHPAAERWQTKALALNPGQVVILGEIARSKLRHGRISAALETLSQAKGEDQSAQPLLQLRGRANIALGRMEQARLDLLAAGRRGKYDLAALEAMTGNPAHANRLFSPAKLADLEADPDPEFRIQLAEVAAALGNDNKAIGLIAQAINLGWRDIKWLKHSPFLGDLLDSKEGQKLESRIARELDTQRRLTEGNKKLVLAINS